MEKMWLCCIAFLLDISAFGQELISPLHPNKDSVLKYTFTLVSEADSGKAAFIGREISRQLQSKGLAVSYLPPADSALVDAVFRMDTPGTVICGNDRIKFRDEATATRKIAKQLERYFYSGQPPFYSTLFRGDDGRYAEYRIPSVVVLPSGRIVAFIEARSGHKDQSENDIVARYSDDSGRSWSARILVAEEGAASLNNPCAVYVPERKQILLMFQCFPPNVTEGNAPVGMKGGRVLRSYVVTSRDGGETWSDPRDITLQVKHPEANSVCSGPGVAIRVMQGPDKGRIIVPFNGNGYTRWFNYIVYSDDFGDSWKIAPGESGYGTNESQIVQLNDTSFLFNARCHRYPDVNTAKNPSGWNPWNFSRVTRNRAHIPVVIKGDKVFWQDVAVQENQPDPTCQGSLIRMERKTPTLLLSNPASQFTEPVTGRAYAQTPPMRMNGTVKVSYDSGKTWSYAKRIYGDRFTEFQYSVLADLGNGKIGCIFEAYPEIKFAVFDLEWVTGGYDK